MHICEPVMPALKLESKPLVVNSEAVKDGGLKVMHVDRVPNNIITVIICFTMGYTPVHKKNQL